LLERHPAIAPIIVGSAAGIDLPAEAYARGGGGLMLWEPVRRGSAGLPSDG